MYEIAPDANNLLPDEPPVLPLGTNPLDYSYLDHIYSANQDETYGLIYDWRDVLEDYKKLNGGDTRYYR